MEGKIEVIIKRTDEEIGHKTAISNTLKNLQTHVGGYIECVTLSPELVIICNEEGRIRNLPYNCRIAGVDFYGDIIIAGVDGEEFGNIPISFKTYKKLLLGVEG